MADRVEKVIIMGAAGRDFHNFNVYFRENSRYKVVAFTATQIPNVEGRLYPPELAGSLYPDGVPIFEEARLDELIQEHQTELVVFSYSDVPHLTVMHKASQVMAKGADFILIGATYTMLRSSKPVIAVCAVRTGCGKSQTTRKVCEIVTDLGLNPVVVRHPMPYGDLAAQAVQRFQVIGDFEKHRCTIEEMEEYEPIIDMGVVVYAGVDYGQILQAAQAEADVIIWDGGNNDTPFYHPNLHIVLFDPHRAGHELLYHPGETNLLMADVAVINKVDTASKQQVEQVRRNIVKHNPNAEIVMASSPVLVNQPERIKGQRVLVVEDGPTLTHGEMAFGAGVVAAGQFGAGHLVDPRPYAAGSLKEVFAKYPHIGPALPAMGYAPEQIKDLEETINQAQADLVLFATPIQLTRLLDLNKPAVRVRYRYQDFGAPGLEEVVRKKLHGLLSKER